MKREMSARNVPQIIAGLLLVGATACSTAAPEEPATSQKAAVEDPCARKPDSYVTNRYGVLGYECINEGDFYTGTHLLRYCRDGQTQTLNCLDVSAYCSDYRDQFPWSLPYCQAWSDF